MSDQSLPHPFTEEEISAALQKTKPVTAPGYDNLHVELLKNLGPKLASGCPNSSPESWLPIPSQDLEKGQGDSS